ncbi:MAG: transglutaminase-like domain-containing protein [Planctomycetota bacterium]
MPRKLIALLLMGCLLLPAFGVAAQADDAPAFEPYEAWFVMRMNGEKVGYMHTQVALDDEGRIVTTSEMRMSIARGTQAIDIEQGSTFIETADHQPIEATSRMLMAMMATEQRLVFGDEAWELTTTGAGGASTQQMDPVETAWLTPGGLMSAFEAALARGDETVELTTLDLSSGTTPVTSVMTRQDEGEVEVFGRTVPATLWVVETDIMPGIEMEQWIDGRGQPVRQSVPLMPGMEIEILLADRELALAEFDAPEVMADMMIHPDRKIENPRRLRRAVYEISGAGLDELDRDQVPTAGGQTVEWVDEDTMRITIIADVVISTALAVDANGERLGPGNEYLAASAALNHEDEAIVALVEEALADSVGLSTDEVCEQLRDFVRGYIDAKNLSVGFATASEVARTGEGDCTEHGVLLAAMLRGAGIPSRTVTGIVYADQFLGGRDIFGYHMWTQAWVEVEDRNGDLVGCWIDLDAAFPGLVDGFDATHIALSTSAQGDDAMINDMVAMLPLMNGLEVKVVELEWADE